MQAPSTSSPQFQIQRLYVIEQSCKLLHTPSIFKQDWNPEIAMEMKIKKTPLEETMYEVILHIHITGKIKALTVLTAEVQQAGIFTIQGYGDTEIETLLNAYCPSILYPYARRVIATATQEASVPALTLLPVNFDAFYAEQQSKQAQITGT